MLVPLQHPFLYQLDTVRSILPLISCLLAPISYHSFGAVEAYCVQPAAGQAAQVWILSLQPMGTGCSDREAEVEGVEAEIEGQGVLNVREVCEGQQWGRGSCPECVCVCSPWVPVRVCVCM